MSDSFIHEFILQTDPQQQKILDTHLEMARFLYNAVLNEGFKRIRLIRESKLFQKAKKNKDIKLYQEVDKQYKFSDYDLQKFAIKTKNNCMIQDHLGAHICQKIATRVYITLNKYRKGKIGKPRFKKRNRFSSFEGKSNETGLRFKNNRLYYKKLVLRPIFDKKDPHKVQNHALSSKVKYCRLIKRKIKNKTVWFLQLILEGKPIIKKKNTSKKSIVGLDIGPSTIAVYKDSKCFLTAFCSKLKPYNLRLKNTQRKMDRSLRKMNPENYDEKKRVKSKTTPWIKSKRYKKNQNKLFEIYRKLKTFRKRLHGQLANEIIKLGNTIRTENISFKGFQKIFGRSIGYRAPGMFLQILNRKAENAGGLVEKIATRSTCLSQVCHNCEKKVKKPLNQRWHQCNCGIQPVQRDLYSAFLARFVENNILDISQCKKNWPGAHLLLEQAMLRLNQTANGKLRLSSFGLSQRQSGSFVKDRSIANNLKDVVGVFREPYKFAKIAVRTSLL